MDRRAGYVLTGGRSSRFGSNKAFVDVNGQPMVAHVAQQVRAASDTVTLVGPVETYGSLGLRVIEDGINDFGPAAGILAALEDSSAPWTLVVACDLPNVRSVFLEMLFRRAESTCVDVVIPLGLDGREQPLCAVYNKGAVAPIRQAVEMGVSKVRNVIGGLSKAYLLPPEYVSIDPSGEMLLNVNRPEDLAGRR